MRKKTVIILIVAAALVVLLAAGATAGGYLLSNSDKVMPNVYVGDILVGGLTKEQTRLALEQRGWSDRVTKPLTVTLPADMSFEINPVTSGGALSIDNAVDAAYEYGHSGNIFENLFTYIELFFKGVDVNELCRQQNDSYIDSCIDAAVEKYNESLGEKEYEFDWQDGKLILKKGWGQTEFDRDDLRDKIAEAVAGGETALKYTKLANELTIPDFVAIRDELDITPVDAHYTDDNKFNIVDEIDGAKLDVSKAAELWNAAGPGETVEIPVEIVSPEITHEVLENRLYHDLLGAMTTRYTNSGENRCSNVRLATSMINETILYPGDTFSYNTVVGARTEAAGFLPAPAYVAVGEAAKDEIGGGACQVSSTLYMAAQFSFLEIIERSNHIFPVNYIQLGTDATVTIPDEGQEYDLVFKNTRNYPIKLVGYCNEVEATENTEAEKSVTFEIWGTLEDDDYMPVEFDNSFGWEHPYDRVIEPAYADREGYKIKFEVERYNFEDDIGHGFRTLTHRKVYNSAGEVVEDVIVNKVLASGDPGMDTYYEHEVKN